MKKLNIYISFVSLLLVCTLFFSCEDNTYVDTIPESNIDKSLFGAYFERKLFGEGSSGVTLDPQLDTIAFPINGNADSFEAFNMTNKLRVINGIRTLEVKQKLIPFFENYDASKYHRGSELVFRFNISPSSDITFDTPFSRDELLDFLVEGKVYGTEANKVGQIELFYSGIDEEDMGIVNRAYEAAGFSEFIKLNNIAIEKIEDFEDLDYDGNVLSKGLRVEMSFIFNGIIQNFNLPFEYVFCELTNGRATVYLEYE